MSRFFFYQSLRFPIACPIILPFSFKACLPVFSLMVLSQTLPQVPFSSFISSALVSIEISSFCRNNFYAFTIKNSCPAVIDYSMILSSILLLCDITDPNKHSIKYSKANDIFIYRIALTIRMLSIS